MIQAYVTTRYPTQTNTTLIASYSLQKQLFSEYTGTAALLCTVIGSGIMADTLTDDIALSLLANTLATGAALIMLITIGGNTFDFCSGDAMLSPPAMLARYFVETSDHQGFQVAGFVLKMLQHGQCLHGFTKAHIIGQTAAETEALARQAG